MIIWDKISIWWHDQFRRRRLSLFSNRDNREVWYTHISPVNLLMAIAATLLFIFVIALTLIVYTPLIEHLPGYRNRTIETHRNIVESMVRIDSMERVIKNMMIYSNNVSSIMSGKGAEVTALIKSDSIFEDKEVVYPNLADSLLRAEMEGDGRYNIAISSIWGEDGLILPISGVVTRRFDISTGSYGVEILAADGGRVVATQRGVVLLAYWSYESDYIVEIVHPNNMISIYRNIKNVTVERGESVKAGEVIGYNSGDKSDDDTPDSLYMEFEIWMNGKPVDPERYIIF